MIKSRNSLYLGYLSKQAGYSRDIFFYLGDLTNQTYFNQDKFFYPALQQLIMSNYIIKKILEYKLPPKIRLNI